VDFFFFSKTDEIEQISFRALREKDDVQSRVRTISVLAVLLQGPFDTGNAILGSQNLVNLMIQMAGSNDPVQEVKCSLSF
jgi:hypothetical protein